MQRAAALHHHGVHAAPGEVPPADPVAPAIQIGVEIPGTDTSTLSDPDGTGYGKPNQSRLWYNTMAGRWDGLLPRNDGGASASDHYIVEDLGEAAPTEGAARSYAIRLRVRSLTFSSMVCRTPRRRSFVKEGSCSRISLGVAVKVAPST